MRYIFSHKVFLRRRVPCISWHLYIREYIRQVIRSIPTQEIIFSTISDINWHFSCSHLLLTHQTHFFQGVEIWRKSPQFVKEKNTKLPDWTHALLLVFGPSQRGAKSVFSPKLLVSSRIWPFSCLAVLKWRFFLLLSEVKFVPEFKWGMGSKEAKPDPEWVSHSDNLSRSKILSHCVC